MINGPSPASIRRRLEDIDTTIASLHSQLAQLTIARRAVVEELKSVTFPILDLPVEITSAIFIQYCQDPIDIGELELMGPFLLASVCQRWRTIALRLHQLWSRIVLSSGVGRLSRVVKRLELCLERAGSVSHLDIDFADDHTQKHLLPLLTATATQWCKLEVFATNNRPGFSDIRGRLSRLRSLKLWRNWDEELDYPISSFEDAPLLTDVELFDLAENWVTLPWAQLRSLTLEYDTPTDPAAILRILRQTTQLKTLQLRVLGQPLDYASVPELRLEQLSTLTLRWWPRTFHATRPWLKILTAPALSYLTTDIPDDHTTLPEMIARCGATLQSLTLNSHGQTLDVIYHVLRNIPFLRRLTVNEVVSTQLSILFDALTRNDTVIHELSVEVMGLRVPYPELALFARATGV
ncbi:hypothetical protein C8F01DRAFT_1146987 [Mycena amicta]|nr:hypothetical protein C8F01DRAFT_1146987 [Mycena amicta]